MQGTSFLRGSVAVPKMALLLIGVLLVVVGGWSAAIATDRNPLPFPDRDYHVFSAATPSALVALERLMQTHGHRPRFRIDTDQVERTIFSNGTIINYPQRQLLDRLGSPAGALGFVVSDPEQAAEDAVRLFRDSGFEAEVIRDAEPGLPIAFVRTTALSGAAIVFRKHVIHMGQKPPAWTPR